MHAPESTMKLAKRINRLRIEHEQSLQDVANQVGVSKAHIWEIEKGRTDNPSMNLVQRLADHFDVSVSYLVSEDVNAPDNDDRIARMFRQAQDLDPRDLETLDALLQSFRERTNA